MRLSEAVTALRQQGLDRLDAQMLVLLAIGHDPHDRAWLLAHDDQSLSVEHQMRLETLTQRRLAGEPMAYLRGEQAFFGLNLAVDARVLVPRPDTETLVNWALSLGTQLPAAAQVVDLGTGSGAIALALRHAAVAWQVSATDASADALAVAEANAKRLDLPVRFRQGTWLEAVAGERFDLIVSNPPYIAAGDRHLEDLRHEPLSALTAGADGLDDLRRIVAQAPAALQPGGWLLLEHGFDQAPAVRTLLTAAGFEQVQSRDDIAGIARCSGGCWPGAR